MKRHLPTLLILLLTFATGHVQAQNFTIEPNEVSVEVQSFQFEGIAHSLVVNLSPDTTFFMWEREVLAISSGWNSAVCDKNQCHSYGVSTEDFWLEPGGEGTMDVHAYPFNNEGSAIIKVHVWDVAEPETVVTGSYLFNETVGVAERLSEAIKIYPNPADDIIFIEQSAAEKVNRIELFSLTGKQVMNSSLNTDNTISVGHLSTGAYVARMFNASGVQVSTNVMIKR